MEGPRGQFSESPDELQLFKNDISRAAKCSGRKKRDFMMDGWEKHWINKNQRHCG